MERMKANSEFGIRNSDFLVLTLSFMVFLVVLFFPLPALACPGCKEALFDPGQLAEKIATAKGYALSIGLLLAVPFLLIAGVIALVARNAHRVAAEPARIADGIDTPR